MQETQENMPQLELIQQQLKDLSFENIAPIIPLLQDGEEPHLERVFNISTKLAHPDQKIYEISLSLHLRCSVRSQPAFILEVLYEGAFFIDGMNEELLHFCLFNECPRLLFPYLRKIVSDIAYEGNLGSLLLSYADFMSQMNEQMKQHKKEYDHTT